MLELINRFRARPREELALLTSSLGTPARSNDPLIDQATRQFNVSGPLLQQQFAGLAAAQPLAWNLDLYEAAEFHSNTMIQRDDQQHEFAGLPTLAQRASNAGYTSYSTLGENIYAYARSVLHGHAGFIIDWGNRPGDIGGIQTPPGHRDSTLNPAFREIGIRILYDSSAQTSVGPLVITQDLGSRFNQGSAFLLGVAYDDATTDGYSAGEGIGGVTVTATGTSGTFTTTTRTAGGYQMQLPAGTYNVTFSGGQFGPGMIFAGVTIGSQNVKIDGELGTSPPTPDVAVEFVASETVAVAIVNGDTTPDPSDGTDFGTVNVSNEAVFRTFVIRNVGNANLLLTGSPLVSVSGFGLNIFLVTSSPAASLLTPGQSVGFTIRYDPPVTGVRTATITIPTNVLNEVNFTFTVRGEGVIRPEVHVTGRGVPIADDDSTPTTADGTNFGGINVESGAKIRLFQVANTGSSILLLSRWGGGAGGVVTIIGEGRADFAVLTQPAVSIPPGGVTTIKVRFNPSAAGFRTASLRFGTNDVGENPYKFALRGTGLVYPRIEVFGGTQPGAGTAIVAGETTPSTADMTDFGSTEVSERARIRNYTIRNDGLGNLVLSGADRVTISGAHAGDFSVIIQPAATLAPGATGTFRVRFDPTAAGARSAIVLIASNDLNIPLFTFAVGGFGV